MAFEIQSGSASPGGTVTLEFSGPVQQYVVGISWFYLSFGEDVNHHVESTSLALMPSANGNVVTVGVTATLMDDSGHTVDAGTSTCSVVCLAFTSTPDSKTVLNNPPGSIASGDASEAIPLPGSVMQSPVLGFLSGFNLSYGSNVNHLVEGMVLTANGTSTGASGYVNCANATMFDDSGNVATIAAINGGFLATANSSPGYTSQQVQGQASDGTTVTFPFTVGSAAVLLSSWQVQFPNSEDHHVMCFAGGCTGWSIDGANVKLNDYKALINDDSGNIADDNLSKVTVWVIATPETPGDVRAR